MTAEEQARYVGFVNATRQNLQMLPAVNYPNGGGTVQIAMPPTGVLASIMVWIEAKFTTNAASGGRTWTNKAGADVTPHNIVKRVSVKTNGGAAIYDTSGWGNYLWSRTLRSGYDYRNMPPTFESTSADGIVFNLPGGYVADTQYTVRFPVIIPIAQNQSLQNGLILLQNKSTVISLEMVFGDIANELLTLAGGATITVNSVTIQPMVEFFNLPEDPINYPDTSKVHRIVEQVTPIVAGGDFRYDVPTGNVYTGILQEFVNNGQRLNPVYVGNLSLVYAVSQTPYQISSQMKLIEQARFFGAHLPRSVFFWRFAGALGIPEIANARDYIDTGTQTSVQLITQLSQDIAYQNAYVRTIREELLISA